MPDLWVEVDLDAVKHNYEQVVSLLEPSCRVMAVVKGDGYGLGAVEAARILQESGCEAFAVTTVAEALTLREHGIEGTILVLGPSAPRDWPKALEARIQLTVSQLAWIPVLDEIASEHNKRAEIQLEVETGMGRTGFLDTMIPDLAEALNNAKHIEVMGAYTHFARAAQKDHSYTRIQNKKFLSFIEKLVGLGINIPLKHVCNSAAFLDHPEYHYDMVRIGTLLGGHFPSIAFRGGLDLRDPWKAKARIVHLQQVGKGTPVGYQSIYKSKNHTTLAVIAAGYADGFGVEPRFVPQGILDLIKIIIKNIASLGGIQLGQEKILFKGKSITIAGKIGMQLTVLDIGEVECHLGEEVEIPLRRTVANPRIPRIYIKNKEIFRMREIKEGFLSLNTEYSNLTN